MKPSTYNVFTLRVVLPSKNLSFSFDIPVQKDLIDLLIDTTRTRTCDDLRLVIYF